MGGGDAVYEAGNLISKIGLFIVTGHCGTLERGSQVAWGY
jgi:hypothetical protein